MLFRSGNEFDIDNALNDLIGKYGVQVENEEAPGKKRQKRDSSSAVPSDDEDVEEKPKRKINKTDIVANEENRGIAEAIREMGVIYFTNKDARKGGVFSKAAKAIRECETPIKSKKDAKALKGVGEGIASYIQEYLDTGVISKLEELRAGTA